MNDYSISFIISNTVRVMPRGKARKKKDPNAPKRARSAYLFFVSAVRDAVKQEFPELSFGETQKKLAEKYKQLSKDEKAKYDDMAAKDRERYEREMDNYTPPPDDSDSDSDSDSDRDVPVTNLKKKEEEGDEALASAKDHGKIYLVRETRYAMLVLIQNLFHY